MLDKNNSNNANLNTVVTPQNREHVLIYITSEETENRGLILRD